MKKHHVNHLTLVSLFFLLMTIGGCGSTPPSKFYTLHSLGDLGTKQQSIPADPGISVGIRPVEIPGYLDRTQIVTRNSLNELKIAEFERWSGSLRENINMILAENISILLASDRILSYPWDPTVKVDYWITVNVIRLEGIPGDHVSLKAQWIISSSKEDKETVIRISDLREKIGENSYEAMVAAMSRTFERLSHEIAAEIAKIK
jgi:uncharacterized lipoprotein YmbA